MKEMCDVPLHCIASWPAPIQEKSRSLDSVCSAGQTLPAGQSRPDDHGDDGEDGRMHSSCVKAEGSAMIHDS